MKLDNKIMENEMLGILNATVSHELRNPLSSIIGQSTKKEAILKKIKEICHEKKLYDLTYMIGEI